MAIHVGSRYEKTGVYNFFDEQKERVLPTLQKRSLLTLPPNSEVIYYQIREGDTLDHLAYRFLKDPALWWVILDVNPRFFTPFDIKIGDTLFIPTEDTLRKMLDEL